MQFPSLFDTSASDLVRHDFEIRYDDLTQHGHIKLPALQLVLGRVCFGEVWRRHPLYATRHQAIVPILSRLVLEADQVPVSFTAPLEGRGQVQLAHESAADGGASALFLNAYGEIWARKSLRRKDGEPRPLVCIGRAFGEHIFTRPFGPPAQRKVLAFDAADQPSVPPLRHRRRTIPEILSPPHGAHVHDAAFALDEAPWVFGLAHTDANQHVNSLIYARFFEEAALRHLARNGHGGALGGSRIELAYRKPCFAGQTMYCWLRSYTHENVAGAVGYLTDEPAPTDKPHCTFHLQLKSFAA